MTSFLTECDDCGRVVDSFVNRRCPNLDCGAAIPLSVGAPDAHNSTDADGYTARRAGAEMFVIDADEDGECGEWVAAENPVGNEP